MRYTQREVNLHTHTMLSHHGKGMPRDYLRCAEEGGNIRVLGFSEHVPLSDSRYPKERLHAEDLPLYIESVRELESGRITVLLGMECDWERKFSSYYRDKVLGEWGCDYIIGSVHYLPDSDGVMKYVGKPANRGLFSLSQYVSLYTDMLSSSLFLYGCHPDLFFSVFPEWNEETKAASEDIIAAAKETGMPLEINGNGFRKKKMLLPDGSERFLYPVREFWELAEAEGVKIVTSSDAHRSELVDIWEEASAFSSPIGIRWAEYELGDGKRIEIV